MGACGTKDARVDSELSGAPPPPAHANTEGNESKDSPQEQLAKQNEDANANQNASVNTAGSGVKTTAPPEEAAAGGKQTPVVNRSANNGTDPGVDGDDAKKRDVVREEKDNTVQPRKRRSDPSQYDKARERGSAADASATSPISTDADVNGSSSATPTKKDKREKKEKRRSKRGKKEKRRHHRERSKDSNNSGEQTQQLVESGRNGTASQQPQAPKLDDVLVDASAASNGKDGGDDDEDTSTGGSGTSSNSGSSSSSDKPGGVTSSWDDSDDDDDGGNGNGGGGGEARYNRNKAIDLSNVQLLPREEVSGIKGFGGTRCQIGGSCLDGRLTHKLKCARCGYRVYRFPHRRCVTLCVS